MSSQTETITRAISYSVLLSAGVLLFNALWGQPTAILTLLLALLVAFAGGLTLMRLWAPQPQKTLPALRYSLLTATLGLLLLLAQVSRHDWLLLLPGVILSGFGLGSATQLTTVLLKPLAKISASAKAALLTTAGVILLGTLLVQYHATSEFAIALLLDLVLLNALLVRIAESDAAI